MHGPEALCGTFATGGTRAEARAYARRIAAEHYENFPVVSLLVPRRLRQDFCNVYAFCRTADDLADGGERPGAALEALDRLREQTLACLAGSPDSMLFVALQETITRHTIPARPFLDLIDAFAQDQRVTRYSTFAGLLDYCARSANPVGRLVLYVCGYRDARRQELADRTCTALQLTNFWQDVRRDLLDLGRIYIPEEDLARFGVTEGEFREQARCGRCDDRLKRLLHFEVDRTDAMFDEGDGLLPLLDPATRAPVALFGRGGRAVLRAIRRIDYDTLARRPTLSAWQKSSLVVRALAWTWLRNGQGRAA